MDPNQNYLTESHTAWWFGVVEDRMDPEKLGRVRVRIHGYHAGPNITPTDHLPWAIVIQDVSNALLEGTGISPTGIQVGTTVMGIFLDGDRSMAPIVLGGLVGKNKGGKRDTSNLTRGESLSETVAQKKKESTIISKADSVINSGLGPIQTLKDSIQGAAQQVQSTLNEARDSIRKIGIPSLTNQMNSISDTFGKMNQALDQVDSIQRDMSQTFQAIDQIQNIPDQIRSQFEQGVANLSGSLRNQADAIQGAIDGLGNIPNQLKADLEASLQIPQRLTGVTDAVNQVQGQIDGFKNALDTQVTSFQRNLDTLKNMNPEQLARTLGNQISGDIQHTLNQLQKLDISNVTSALNSIPGISQGMQKLMSQVSDISKVQNLVAKIKGFASALPNMGSIKGLAKGIVSGNKWDEPQTPADPSYPYNQVRESEGGHVEEFDNTEGKERYHRYHPTGTFIEIHPDGTQVEKIVKDDYQITLGDKFIHVEGNVQVNIVGNTTLVVNGDCTTEVTGNKVDVVSGDYTLAVAGEYAVSVGGRHKQSSGVHFKATAPRIDLN